MSVCHKDVSFQKYEAGEKFALILDSLSEDTIKF